MKKKSIVGAALAAGAIAMVPAAIGIAAPATTAAGQGAKQASPSYTVSADSFTLGYWAGSQANAYTLQVTPTPGTTGTLTEDGTGQYLGTIPVSITMQNGSNPVSTSSISAEEVVTNATISANQFIGDITLASTQVDNASNAIDVAYGTDGSGGVQYNTFELQAQPLVPLDYSFPLVSASNNYDYALQSSSGTYSMQFTPYIQNPVTEQWGPQGTYTADFSNMNFALTPNTASHPAR